MDLDPYVENIQRQLDVAADAGGDDARVLAERLIAPLDAAVRLTLLDVLAAAVEQITTDLAPGSVQLRLRGREPEFVVTPPETAEDFAEGEDRLSPSRPAAIALSEGDEGAMSRTTLRLHDRLKASIEQAAAAEGLSVNAWLVRAAAAAVDRARSDGQPTLHAPKARQHYTGWAR